MATTVASQIEIDDHGVAWIAGANTKVVEVAGWRRAAFQALRFISILTDVPDMPKL